MSKIVTATKAKNAFGEMIRWAKETKESVVVKQYGEPAVVIVDYETYRQLENESTLLKRQRALAAFNRVREEVLANLPPVNPEELYREAGISEEIIRETIEFEKTLAERGR